MMKVIKEVFALLWKVLRQVLWQRIKKVLWRLALLGLVLGVVLALVALFLR